MKQLINFYIHVKGIAWNPQLPRGIIRSHRTDLGNVTAASKTSHRTEKRKLAWPISLIIQTIALGLNLKGRTKCLLHHVLGKIAKVYLWILHTMASCFDYEPTELSKLATQQAKLKARKKKKPKIKKQNRTSTEHNFLYSVMLGQKYYVRPNVDKWLC